MDLQQFISLSLTQIIQGVADAQKAIGGNGGNAYVAPIVSTRERNEPKDVSFDIAVTASENLDMGGKAGVQVLTLKLGGDISKTSGTETVSRIQFTVPVVFPGEKPAEDARRHQHDDELIRGSKGHAGF